MNEPLSRYYNCHCYCLEVVGEESEERSGFSRVCEAKAQGNSCFLAFLII
jgi:hypothetical protein